MSKESVDTIKTFAAPENAVSSVLGMSKSPTRKVTLGICGARESERVVPTMEGPAPAVNSDKYPRVARPRPPVAPVTIIDIVGFYRRYEVCYSYITFRK